MTEFSIQTLTRLLPDHCRRIVIGYSGGIDSHVLLHLCAFQPEIKNKVTAVYIHHGLQQAAGDWGEHCRQQCLILGVDFKMIRVNAEAMPGDSPEAAARNARYSALQGLLEPGDVLLLAQHREDQMETVLLQLFRGSGVQGLAAMPVCAVFGRGLMLRPLLDVAKKEIQQYAARHELHWVDDPSNQSCDFDRNYLRNQVVPLLKQRWPSLDMTVARSARHCGDAARLLGDWAGQALEAIVDPRDRSLSISAWSQFNSHQGNWLLRQWLRMLGLRPPSQAILKSLVEQLIHAKDTADPQIFTQGYYIRKYRRKLFCISEAYFCKELDVRQWDRRDVVFEMMNGYKLTRIESSAGIDKRLWDARVVTVGNRVGGEKIKIPGRAGHHCLKKLYQEAGIPPWDRDLRPLVYLNGRLAAVAGLWVAEWAWSLREGDCYRLLWQP
jgi:tRNA(Ile)-lysidine synthase